MLGDIDDGSGLALAFGSSQSGFFADERPQFVSVDYRGPLPVSLQVEHSDSFLSEVSLMAVLKRRNG